MTPWREDFFGEVMRRKKEVSRKREGFIERRSPKGGSNKGEKGIWKRG